MAQSTTTTSRSFSTSAWKAVAAAGVGVALLAAGGTTFAEWSDKETVAQDTIIDSGVLDLSAGTGTWTNIVGEDITAELAAGTYAIVPGNTLTYRETLTVDAQGDLLQASVSHNLGELTGDTELRAQLEASSAMTLNGQAVTGTSAVVTATDEVQTVDVAVTVDFDSDTAGLVGQGQSVELAGLDIALDQVPVSSD